jgi:hypothetical protein
MSSTTDAVTTVQEFVTAMYEWERSCRRSARARLGPSASTRAVAEFCLRLRDEVLDRYCITGMRYGNLVMGEPPLYSPSRESVVGSEVTAASAEVRTECRNDKERLYLGYRWKYDLVCDGARWRIAQRYVALPSAQDYQKVDVV